MNVTDNGLRCGRVFGGLLAAGAMFLGHAGCGPEGGAGGPIDPTNLGVFTPGTTTTVVAGTQTTTIIDGFTVTPSRLDFGDDLSTQYFTVSNNTGGVVGFEILGGADWFTVSPRVAVVADGGSMQVEVSVYRVVILDGVAAGNFQISIPGREAVTIPVTVGDVPIPDDGGTGGGGGGDGGGTSGGGGGNGGSAALMLNTGSLDFGSGMGALNFLVRNGGGGSLSYKASPSAAWLRIDNDEGVSNGEFRPVRVSVDRRDLPLGNYNGTITVTSPAGTQQVAVAMNVSALDTSDSSRPQPFLAHTLLDFGAAVTRLQAYVRNDGAAMVGFRATPSASWIRLSTNGGVNRGFGHAMTVVVSREGLAAGEYWGNVEFAFDHGVTRTMLVRMVVPDATPPAAALAIPYSHVELGATGSSASVSVLARPLGTALNFHAVSSVPWMSVTPASGVAQAAGSAVTIAVDRGQLPPGDHDGYLQVVSEDGQMREVHVHVLVPASGDGRVPPMTWGASDARLDVMSFIEPGAPGYILPQSVGFDPDWWANTPYVHHVHDSDPGPLSPRYIRQTIEALQATNGECMFGTYISGTACRKMAQMTKFPPESIPYEAVSGLYYLEEYDEATQRAHINLANADARRQMADLISQEAIGRGVRGVFLDNMSHPSTGGTRASWAEVCDYLGSIRSRLNAHGMRLLVNLACQPYYLAGADAELAISAVDGFNFEQPFHWYYCRPFPERVAAEIEVYRHWLDAGLHLSIMAAHSEIVNDQGRRFEEARVLAAMCMMVRRPGDSIGVPRSYFETPPDWVDWPAQFGAALGDYSMNPVGPVLTREFQHAVISVDLSKSTNPAQAASAVTVTWR